MFLSDFGQELFYSRLKLCHPINICPYLNSEDCSDVSTVLKKPPFWMVFSLNALVVGDLSLSFSIMKYSSTQGNVSACFT